ncbi:uncharacterized protein MONOS_17348 [Monocercomonoides exilis]|uniref:uncharacterized protein n=1 Tax=Monocercomonoides exilis TaxID=2049356 RepID=UPI003559DE2D|nr:hypothetical protein MONOS_17348 [Monocercomonoides exilis]
MSCLQKVASKKEENEEVQKEVEMALISLNSIIFCFIKQKEYLSEIKEIIKYHQEHRNLSHLACQSAWDILIFEFFKEKSFKEVVVNELHFIREAARELEDLSKSVDWKREKAEEKGERKVKEMHVIWRWIRIVDNFLNWSTLMNEEIIVLICSIVHRK